MSFARAFEYFEIFYDLPVANARIFFVQLAVGKLYIHNNEIKLAYNRIENFTVGVSARFNTKVVVSELVYEF